MQRRQGSEEQGDDRQEYERRQRAQHQWKGEAHGQLAGGGIGVASALLTSFERQPFEHGRQR
ncbi:MAG: hypothetical protein QOJ66_3274, partial [Ilumatobacteraceae bacterium]